MFIELYRKYQKMTWIAISLCIVAAAVGIGSKYIFSGQEDNPIEEAAEELIKKQTGLDVDLSPSSPEKGKR